jgi:arylsulfatase A-like enzyme
MKRAATILGLSLLFLPGLTAMGAGDRNVLLVTLDTTRADRLGCYGYERDTSPTVDAVAADAVLFSRAYSVVPLTTPSHVSIMTGLHPVNHRIYRNAQPVPDELVTMAELLKARGYATAAFVSAIVLSGRSRIDDGFDLYSGVVDRPRRASRDPRRRMRSADETVDAALGWLTRHRAEKFFLWLHLYEPHLPYLPPDEYGLKFDPAYAVYKRKIQDRLELGDGPAAHLDDLPGPGAGDREQPPHPGGRRGGAFPRPMATAEVTRMRNAYDGEIAFADAQLSRVVGFLKQAKLYDETIVVVMADHGEILYEQRQYFGHHRFMYEGALEIPLIFRIPGVGARRLEERITNVDVLPTLLGALGIEAPSPGDGVSFWPLIRDGREVRGRPHEILVSHTQQRGPEPIAEGVFDPTGVLNDRWKLLVKSRGGEPEARLELYDLNADPAERKNLYDPKAESPIARELQAYLDSYLEVLRDRPIRPEAIDPETEERLRSLGYIP